MEFHFLRGYSLQRGKAATEEKALNTEVTEASQRSQSLLRVFSVTSKVLLRALCVESFLPEPRRSLGLVLQRGLGPQPKAVFLR